MKNKAIIISTVLLLVLTSLFAGCINSNQNGNEDENDGIIVVADVLELGETKTIEFADAIYELTINELDSENFTLSIGSNESVFALKKGTPIEIDHDFDGVNDFEIEITSVSGSKVSIILITTTSTSKYHYIKDDLGDNVRVPKKIEKIISLASSITEILYSLNMGDKIVGRDSGSNYPSDANKIEVVATFEGIDLEKVLAKDPDIIIMDKTLDLSENNYQKMVDYGLSVFRVYPKNMQDVLDNIELIGKVVDNKGTAKALVSDLETRIDTVRTRGDAFTTNPKVLHVIYYGGPEAGSPWVGSTSTISGDLISIAGGDVVVKDGQGFSLQRSVEQIIGYNPDIIFTSQDNTWPTPSREAILNDDALENVNAVKNGKVIDINADLVDRPGPRLVDGLELISNYISSQE
jgi:iron complex transport system substrate-binding protein